MKQRLTYEILRQPDDTTCGPTCLQSVYRYYGDSVPLDNVIAEVGKLQDGGTLAVFLGEHALRRGYDATIYTFNLQVFDPSWFPAEPTNLIKRLQAQSQAKESRKLRLATDAYIDFLQLGGEIRMDILNGNLIRKFLKHETPILTGLSATYLYGEKRERLSVTNQTKSIPDDIAGHPQGHFVVLCGYDSKEREVVIADPLMPNPLAEDHLYEVRLDRVICAILLGIVTYDANLLVIRPRKVQGKTTEPPA